MKKLIRRPFIKVFLLLAAVSMVNYCGEGKKEESTKTTGQICYDNCMKECAAGVGCEKLCHEKCDDVLTEDTKDGGKTTGQICYDNCMKECAAGVGCEKLCHEKCDDVLTDGK